MTICRGTNPTLTFNFPFELALSNCDISFAQKGFIIISKSLNDCSIDGKTLSISLSQTETMLLNPGTVTIQFRICQNNKFLNSNCITAGVADVINGEILPEVSQ